jgi:hypothetical protein
MSALEGLCAGASGAAHGRGQMLVGEGEEGARGRRAGGGPPDQQDAAVQLRVGEAEPDQPGGALQPGRGQHRDAELLGGQLALLTWAGAFAVVLLVLTIAGPAMAGWPLALRALVLSGLMVAAMTWVIVPVTTRLFGGWLLH